MQDIWDAVVGEVLDCEVSKTLDFKDVITVLCLWSKRIISNLFPLHEPDNPRDTHAIAVKRVQGQQGKQEIMGHLPLTLSRMFHLILNHSGQISVEVTGKRRNKGIGLEIPATYTFYHKKPSKIKKLLELIKKLRRICRCAKSVSVGIDFIMSC